MDEIEQLVITIQQSCDEETSSAAFARFYELIKPSIVGVVSGFKLVGYEREDLLQISITSIYKKMQDFKQYGIPFEQFAKVVARRRCGEIWKIVKRKKITYQLEDWDRGYTDDPLQKLIDKEEQEISDRLVRRITLSMTRTVKAPEPKIKKCNIPKPSKPDFSKAVVYGRRVDPFSKSVRRLDTGEIYADLYEASRMNNNRPRKGANASKVAIVNSIKMGTLCAGTKWAWAESLADMFPNRNLRSHAA